MKSEKSRSSQRFLYWTFILYPESAPQNWRGVLDEEHIAWIESPLHNKDVDAIGEPKKDHWHILLMFEGVKTFEQVKEITDKLNAPMPQKCNGVKGLVRYMAHLDNPEKAQYSKSDIVAHGGADLDSLFAPSSSQRYQYIKEMCKFVADNNMTEFQDIVDYAMTERFEDWFPLLCDSCSIIVGKYISSFRHRRQSTEAVRVIKVNENGEVISDGSNMMKNV